MTARRERFMSLWAANSLVLLISCACTNVFCDFSQTVNEKDININ